MTVLANDRKDQFTVIAAGFCSGDELWDRLPINDQDHQSGPTPIGRIGETHDAIEAYLSGDISALADIRVRQTGTDLQQEVWNGLRRIPPGETRTYTELAAATSKPKAVRAVGSACGRNLIAPMVPCHRALRSDGSLGGYYYGLEVKQWLLAHEGYDQPRKTSSGTTPGQLAFPT